MNLCLKLALLGWLGLLVACGSAPVVMQPLSAQHKAELQGKTIALYIRPQYIRGPNTSGFRTGEVVEPSELQRAFAAEVLTSLAARSGAIPGKTFVPHSILQEIDTRTSTQADFILVVEDRANLAGGSAFGSKDQLIAMKIRGYQIGTIQLRRADDWSRVAYAQCESEYPKPEDMQETLYSEASWRAYLQSSEFKAYDKIAAEQCFEQLFVGLGI